MDDGLSGLGRRSALAMAGAGVSGVGMIAVLLIASRTLSGAEAGSFFVAIALFAIVQGVCSLGLETAMQYFVPTLTSVGARALIGRVAAGALAAGSVAAIVVWLLAHPLGDLLAEGEAGDVTGTIRRLALVLPFAGLYEISVGALSSADRVLVATLTDRIVRPVLQVTGLLVAGALSLGSSGAVLAWALPHLLVILVAVATLAPKRPSRAQDDRPDTVAVRTFAGYAAPRSIARVSQTLTQRLDVIILAAVFPLEDAAIYATVSRCMIAGAFIATALRQTIQPQLRRLIVRGDPDAVRSMYGASTTWLVIVAWPVYLAMMTFAPLVMRAFGEDYVRGDTALVLLCGAMLVASGCGLVDVVLLMLGRSWLSTAIIVTALVVNIGLNLVLAPRFGMIGAAVAWVVAILVTNLGPLWFVSRAGIHPGGTPLLTATTTAVVTVAGPLLLVRTVAGTGLLAFLVGATIAALCYLGTLRVLRQRVLLDRLVADLRRRRPRSATDGEAIGA